MTTHEGEALSEIEMALLDAATKDPRGTLDISRRALGREYPVVTTIAEGGARFEGEEYVQALHHLARLGHFVQEDDETFVLASARRAPDQRSK